jgi:hypothetical protein
MSSEARVTALVNPSIVYKKVGSMVLNSSPLKVWILSPKNVSKRVISFGRTEEDERNPSLRFPEMLLLVLSTLRRLVILGIFLENFISLILNQTSCAVQKFSV